MPTGMFLFCSTIIFNDYSSYAQTGAPSDISANILSITNNASTLDAQDVAIIVDLLAQLVQFGKNNKQVCWMH